MAHQNLKKESDELIIKTAAETAKKTAGVAGMAPRGIRIEHTKKGININVFMIVEYGKKIPEVAWDVQENIMHAVTKITDITLEKVNINIQGVE